MKTKLLSTFINYFEALEQCIIARRNLHDFDLKNFKINTKTFEKEMEKFAEHNPNQEECFIILLALLPHIQPGMVDQIISKLFPDGGELPQLGGVRGTNHRGFLPTGETVMFLLAGYDLKERFDLLEYFSSEHWFSKKQVLYLKPVKEGEPKLSGQLILNEELIEHLMLGEASKPTLSITFPAQYISTELNWKDLILQKQTMDQIQDLERWINHHEELMTDWEMYKKLKPGYRALFYGPPGTGKTLTATLLGKYTNRDVYRVDLSMVVSKYIGETEKNLSSLFDKAANKDWILFFDEADAIFGKRTNVRDAHDKYANQEVSYLLQRIEAHPGLVILASNMKTNIDEAFTRRFQSIIYFPMPSATERKLLWKNSFPEKMKWSAKIDVDDIASQYELAGGSIMNVVQHACLLALEHKQKTIEPEYLYLAIRREFEKEGKLVQ